MSVQGTKWVHFADKVLNHIRDYVIPQYGDEGEEPAKDYSLRDCIKQAERYLARVDRNARGKEESKRDMLKAAHWIQKAWDRM